MIGSPCFDKTGGLFLKTQPYAVPFAQAQFKTCKKGEPYQPIQGELLTYWETQQTNCQAKFPVVYLAEDENGQRAVDPNWEAQYHECLETPPKVEQTKTDNKDNNLLKWMIGGGIAAFLFWYFLINSTNSK